MSETPAPLIPPVGEDDPLATLEKLALAERRDWEDRNADRYWQMHRVVAEITKALTLTRQQQANLRAERNAADARLAEVEAERDASESRAEALAEQIAEKDKSIQEAALLLKKAVETLTTFESREAALRAEMEKVETQLAGCAAGVLANTAAAVARELALRQEIETLKQEQATPCVWTEDSDGQWDTACGRKWEFISDGPTENRMDFCHGCGHPVTAVHYVDTLADDDEQDEQDKGTTTP